MAIIKCPECGKEVSDRAPACIHCGFPLHENVTQESNNNQQNIPSAYQVNILDVGPNKVKVIKVVRELTGYGLKEAKALVDNAPFSFLEDSTYDNCMSAKSSLESEGATVSVEPSGSEIGIKK